jgi:hypothetical protein
MNPRTKVVIHMNLGLIIWLVLTTGYTAVLLTIAVLKLVGVCT